MFSPGLHASRTISELTELKPVAFLRFGSWSYARLQAARTSAFRASTCPFRFPAGLATEFRLVLAYNSKRNVSRDTPVSQALHLSIDAFTGTLPATDWKRPPGRPRRTWLQQVEEDMGLPISACHSQPWTASCGDRYDPRPVKSSSK